MKRPFLSSFLVLSLVFMSGCSLKWMGDEENESEKPLRNAPTEVSSAFQSSNPAAENVKWFADGEDFEVEFVLNGTAHSAVYSKSGEMLESESMMDTENLLPAIKQYIAANYAEWEIESAEISKGKDGTVYEVIISEEGDDDEQMELVFDENGTFVSKADAEENEGDENDEDDEQEENEG